MVKAARTDLDRQREEAFASLLQEMEQEDNRDHFDRRADLSRLFNLMARDEEPHAGVLNRAQLAEGLLIGRPSLSGNRTLTWFPLSWVWSMPWRICAPRGRRSPARAAFRGDWPCAASWRAWSPVHSFNP